MMKTEREKAREEEYNFFKQFENKKVKIITRTGREIIGKVLEQVRNEPTGIFMILPKGCRTKGYKLTKDVYDGFFQYITVEKIELIGE